METGHDRIRHIAVLTSGGDAPGMNAFIRAVTRTALNAGCQATGVMGGYQGLVDKDFIQLDSRMVGGIMRHGGTMLQSSRSKEFTTPEGQERAIANMRELGIDGLVVAGGNGSMAGVKALVERGFPAIGVPASIDNDLFGTDTCIGVDTALETIVEAIDKLKDTASSMSRAFVLEVMGRHSGWLALAAGVAGGAEAILTPESKFDLESLVADAQRAKERKKPHYIIVAAEGLGLASGPDSEAFLKAMERSGFSVRVTVLGHVQRGGAPTPSDRILATRLGVEATRSLLAGRFGTMVGMSAGRLVHVPLDEAISRSQPLDAELLALAPLMTI